MSTFTCPVIRVQKFADNPNSDNLCIINGPQGPLQFKKGDLKVGDLACFIPADSLVPVARSEFSFLAGKSDQLGYARVRGIRLRKLPSVGLLIRAPDGIILPNPDGTTFSTAVQVGDDLQHWFGVKKFEPVQTHSFHTHSMQASNPPGLNQSPTYDVENIWQYDGSVINLPETGNPFNVMEYRAIWSITQKIHGVNWRCYMTGSGPDREVHIGSRSRWVKQADGNVWWQAYNRYKDALDALMANNPGTIFFGQAFGKVQDLHYGEQKIDLRLFDSYDVAARRYNSIGHLGRMMLQVPDSLLLMVPIVIQFAGTFSEAIEHGKTVCSGKSLIDGKTMRQGVVIRPTRDELLVFGKEPMRLMTKVVSPEYLSRLNGTEEH